MKILDHIALSGLYGEQIKRLHDTSDPPKGLF